MTEKSYATNVLTILAISVVLMAFIFLLVGHHYGIPERVDWIAARSWAPVRV